MDRRGSNSKGTNPHAQRAGIYDGCGNHGISPLHKIFRHLVPNTMPQLIVTATLGLGGVILYESTLSFLGLGVPFPRAAWGSMIALADPSRGQEILANYPNMWVPAGILIVMTVLGFSFIGDGLRDAFDPRMKR